MNFRRELCVIQSFFQKCLHININILCILYIIMNMGVGGRFIKYVLYNFTMFKRLCVTCPQEDFNFCEDKKLSPSKLLQERITQIRDDASPQLRNIVGILQKKLENKSGKLEHSARMLEKIGEVINEKFGKEVFNEIWEKI